MVLVTHDPEVAARARRQIHVRDGVIEREPAADRAREAGGGVAGRASRRCGSTGCAAADHARRDHRRAAVVMLVAIGTGAKQEVETQVQGLGSNILLVVPGRSPSARRRPCPGSSWPTWTRSARWSATAPGGRHRRSRARPCGPAPSFATVVGRHRDHAKVFVRRAGPGRYLRRSDVDTRRRVAVLGAAVARQAVRRPGPDRPADHIAGVRFRVVGVFAPLGQSLGVDRDQEVHIPITAAQRLLGTARVDALAVKAPGPDEIDELGTRIVAALDDRYPETSSPRSPRSQILGVVGDILGLLTLVLAAIAGISLLVGGVGIIQHHAGLASGSGPGRSGCARRSAPGSGTSGAVPDRGGAADHHRRRASASASAWAPRCWSTRSRRCPPRSPGGRCAGLRGVGRGRRLLRRGAGPAGRPDGPGHRAAYRMTRPWKQGVRRSEGAQSQQYRYSPFSTCVSVVAGGEAGAATRAEVW